MASPPVKVAAPPDDPRLSAMQKQMARLVDIGLQDRNRHQARITDCYALAMPWRHKFNEDRANVNLDQIYDETIGTVLEDFASDMLNTFTPQKNNWLEDKPAEALRPEDKRLLGDRLKRRQEIVFAEMARSNLYQALQEAYQDLGPGTMALVITDIGATMPVHCECLPAPDLIITRGPYGYVDGKFRKRKRTWQDVTILWPDAVMSRIGQTPQNPEVYELDVTDGLWRDWSDKGYETYQYVVEAGGKIVYEKTWKGVGSCPFVVARWARDSTTAWGIGPTYRTLPATKTLNHFAYLTLKNYDKHVDAPTSYEDDGVVNLDNGVEPGDWIARAPGSEPPTPIESKSRFDYEAFQIDEKRSAIRRAHYQDKPEQLGKTPPTATQWADEAAERARRMGTPATNLVQELQIPIYMRFVYLLEERGTIERIRVPGGSAVVEPTSPILRAQQQEAVVRRDKWAELIIGRFGPQLGAVVIDIIKYSQAQGKDLGIEPELMRDEAKLAKAIEQLLPVLQTVTAGGTGAIAPPALGAIAGQV